MNAELVYDPDTCTLRSVGGTVLLTDVTLDEAAEEFTGYVIRCRTP